MKRILGLIFLAVLVAIAVIAMRGSGLSSHQIQVAPAERIDVDTAGAAKRLAAAIPFRTISHFDRSNLDRAAFLDFHAFLERSYPAAHRVLQRERVDDLSLLYTWPGAEASREPVLLLAHQDVVPVPAGTEDRWSQSPWDGVIADGFVWGRGTMDDKGNLMAQLEAVEILAQRGFRPTRTLLLAFGHDEEVAGTGARSVAALLESRGIRADFVLDEGMAVIDGVIPGLDQPAALVGVAEKGYVSVRLNVKQAGGHSSTPPPHTAVGILATAIHNLERAPMPARLEGVSKALFDYLAPELPFSQRVVFANLWLFEPLVMRALAGNPGTNATLRTTTAATMISGSPKDNVLPNEAEAVVNFRVLPGDDVEAVLEHVRAAVGDERVEVSPIGTGSDPSPVSDPESPSFRIVQTTIGEIFPGALVAPALVLGGTDSRYYTGVSDDIYRFGPYRFGADDLGRAHGIDERTDVDSHADAIRFYVRLIENVQQP